MPGNGSLSSSGWMSYDTSGLIDAISLTLLLDPTSRAGGEPVLAAVSVGEAQDALIIGDERTAEFDRGRDQEPIGRIAVRKLVKLVAPGCGAVTERRRLSAGTLQEAGDPALDREIQLDSS